MKYPGSDKVPGQIHSIPSFHLLYEYAWDHDNGEFCEIMLTIVESRESFISYMLTCDRQNLTVDSARLLNIIRN